MLSTMKGMRCFLAIRPMASRSTMTPPGLAIDSTKMAFVRGVMAALEGRGVVGVGPDDVPAEVLVGVIELVDRTAVKLSGGNEFVARLHEGVHGEELGRMPARHRQRRRAVLQRSDPLFQNRAGRVADAGVDVAEGLQAEERGGVVHVVEHEGGGLIDRRGARAGGGVGRRAGVDRKRREAGLAVSHRKNLQRIFLAGALQDRRCVGDAAVHENPLPVLRGEAETALAVRVRGRLRKSLVRRRPHPCGIYPGLDPRLACASGARPFDQARQRARAAEDDRRVRAAGLPAPRGKGGCEAAG